MTLNDSSTDQLMAMAAHRYCLGRSSYIVGVCIEWVRATWPQLTDNTRHVMLRDTVEALMMGTAGHDIDVTEWRDLARWMASQMTPEQIESVRRQLVWRGEDLVREYLP